MLRRRELGYCAVSTTDGSSWHLQRNQFAPVLAAWTKGAIRVDTTDFFGSRLTIDLSRVDSIADVSPAAVMARLSEQRADDTDDALVSGC